MCVCESREKERERKRDLDIVLLYLNIKVNSFVSIVLRRAWNCSHSRVRCISIDR